VKTKHKDLNKLNLGVHRMYILTKSALRGCCLRQGGQLTGKRVNLPGINIQLISFVE